MIWLAVSAYVVIGLREYGGFNYRHVPFEGEVITTRDGVQANGIT